METSFYTEDEVRNLGFKGVGENVLVSRYARIYGASKIKLGNHVRIDDFCILSGGAGITMGNYIHLAPSVYLYGEGGIILEDFVGISSRTALYSATDDYFGLSLIGPLIPMEFKPNYKVGEIVLRKHVLIGTGTTILPGVDIGEGTAIGAHSLVTRSCESWGICTGVPAKRVTARRKKIIELEQRFLQSIHREVDDEK